MSFLKISKLNAFYGDFQALFDISICLYEGQKIALIGPNGAGKSTLLRSIAGWLPVPRKAVKYNKRNIGGLPANDVVSLGIASVPEGRRLFPSLSVKENLQMGQESGRKGVWSQDKVMQIFPVLRERLYHLGSELSGGQQQMVAIGRALMSNPRIVLFDELSLGLAPKVVNEIAKAIPDIQKSGVSIIFVEQDVRRALRLSDYVYCILEGRINLQGQSKNITFEDVEAAFWGQKND
ncbi:MAG: ABC transporter ATP-binding protein [Aestuariivita sp.]|nr:ABC transporter ATP-binding protein [Aestuariivita sp.]